MIARFTLRKNHTKALIKIFGKQKTKNYKDKY